MSLIECPECDLGVSEFALADAIVRIIRRHVRDFSRDPNDVMDHASTAVIRELLDRR